MAFTSYGSGNWFRLPETGFTEKYLGGKTGSTIQASSGSSKGFLPAAGGGSSSGGGGGSWGSDGEVLGTNNTQQTQSPAPQQSPAGGNYSAPSGGSSNQSSNNDSSSQDTYDQEQSMIDDMYNSNNSYLNSLQSNLQSGEQDFYNTYTAPYQSQVPLIEQARDQGLQSIEGQKVTAGQQEQSALAAARQLYNELTQRNQQAFGGGLLSSVGQAAGEILGRGAMQQFGNIRQGAQNTIQGLVTEARNVMEKASAQLQQLNTQKEAALSEARLAFRDKLSEIDRMRNELKSNRSAMKLDALREFRSNIQSIANQATAFKQSLEAMKYQADLNLRNALSSTQQYADAGVQSGQNMLGQQGAGNEISYNRFGAGNQVSAPQSSMSFGGIAIPGVSTSKRREEDAMSVLA